MIDYETYIPDAFDIVSAWELPEEDVAQAVNEQAKLMAGLDPDYFGDNDCPRYQHRPY